MINVLGLGFHFKIWLIASLAFVWLSISHADDVTAPAGTANVNIANSEPSCGVCHGANWQGNSLLGSPNLQILPAWYIRAQIHSYQKGWRVRAQEEAVSDDMISVARALTADQIEFAMAVKARLKPTPLVTNNIAANPSVNELGKQIYEICAACHGRDGLGQQALGAPPLVGQRPEYLKAQLLSFGEGSRGGNKDDAFGQQMAKALPWPMSAQSLEALLLYISTL